MSNQHNYRASRDSLSVSQRLLLDAIRAGKFYAYGPEVRTARSLESLGLVTLTDNGAMVERRNADGERWSVELTEAGKDHRHPRPVGGLRR